MKKLINLMREVSELAQEGIFMEVKAIPEDDLRENYANKIDRLQSVAFELEELADKLKPVECPFQTVEMWATPKSTKELESFLEYLSDEQRPNATHIMMLTWNFMASTMQQSLKQQQGQLDEEQRSET